MLYQIQWRFKDKPNELVAQKEMSPKISKTFDQWTHDVAKRHPLPKGAEWIVCNDKSEYFIKGAE